MEGKDNYMANEILMTEDASISHSNISPYILGFMPFSLPVPEQICASDVVLSIPVSETIFCGFDSVSARPHKKTRHRRSKEGYMSEQQWRDYFDARDKDMPQISGTGIHGTEEEFKSIHSKRIIREA